MKMRKIYGTILTGITLAGAGLFNASDAIAASCSSTGCPVVTSVTHQSGNSYIVNWVSENPGQVWVSAAYNSNFVWGLYLITNYQTSGHYINGGTYRPIKSVTRSDAPVDNCTTSEGFCEHSAFAARFLNKWGPSGTETVEIPAGINSCIVFGVPNRDGTSFLSVYTAFATEPVCGPGGINVPEPVPDPEWCGMSTSALTFDFGDMAPATVAGASLSQSAVMDCSKAGVTYSLYLSNVTTPGRNTIDLGRGVTATVSANGQALQTNRTSTGTINSLNVNVTLSGTPTSTGDIGGTGILAVNYL